MGLLTHWEGEAVESWRAMLGLSALEIYDELPSTNDRGKEVARSGEGGWTLILAESQNRGRGRGEKSWVSAPGKSLLFSLVIPGRGSGWDALLPIRMGLAAAEGLEECVEGDVPPSTLSIGVKWPNDLLLEDRKVGGILCEQGGGGRLVAGVGINLEQTEADFPPDLRDRATSVAMGLGKTVSRYRALKEILRAVRKKLAVEEDSLHPRELEEYGRRDRLKGALVESETAGRGRALGLTPAGHLALLREDGSRVSVRAGSVTRILEIDGGLPGGCGPESEVRPPG